MPKVIPSNRFRRNDQVGTRRGPGFVTRVVWTEPSPYGVGGWSYAVQLLSGGTITVPENALFRELVMERV